MRPAQPVDANVHAALDVASDGERGHRRHRTAADEQAGGRRGKAEQPAKPADHLVFDVYGGMVAAGATRVHGRSQRLREDCPSPPEANSPIPKNADGRFRTERFDRLFEPAEDVIRRYRILRRWGERNASARSGYERAGTPVCPGSVDRLIGDDVDDPITDAPNLSPLGVPSRMGIHLEKR